MAYKTIVEDNIDILVAGAGLSGTGAAFEARYWGQNKKIVIAEKQTSTAPVRLRRACTPLTPTWARASVKTILKTTFVMHVST